MLAQDLFEEYQIVQDAFTIGAEEQNAWMGTGRMGSDVPKSLVCSNEENPFSDKKRRQDRIFVPAPSLSVNRPHLMADGLERLAQSARQRFVQLDQHSSHQRIMGGFSRIIESGL